LLNFFSDGVPLCHAVSPGIEADAKAGSIIKLSLIETGKVEIGLAHIRGTRRFSLHERFLEPHLANRLGHVPPLCGSFIDLVAERR
jgi:hypothetical protein